ncbi:hypothetical protein KTC96_24895 (plasmid) [Clostridium estertheticum]|uniref:hypothetical protein n=1 Tax=Clostridium estertheticum TaxID=238834 RepID=UPI001C7D9BB2|nr:hypothetical protein [Clostridium estertheticum]MBX4259767.1 hypothetical protein [Clostridium estertheticum]WLC73261.1 hypothetical protein KTC96_24895 [Clostridium estertheticum]
MKELVGQVNKLVIEEKTRVMLEHPLFFSRHQGYAILKEEIEEAEDELKVVKQMLEDSWLNVRRNITPYRSILAIRNCSINLAAEAIQVAAVAQKFIDSFKVENE